MYSFSNFRFTSYYQQLALSVQEHTYTSTEHTDANTEKYKLVVAVAVNAEKVVSAGTYSGLEIVECEIQLISNSISDYQASFYFSL